MAKAALMDFDKALELFEPVLGTTDAVVSDRLNDASIIDGIRLCKAQRMRYDNNDMGQLEQCLRDAAGARALAEAALKARVARPEDRIMQRHAAQILPLLRAGNGKAAAALAETLMPLGSVAK